MMDKLGKQSRESSRTEISRTSPLASQTRGSFSPCGSCRCYFPAPGPGVGTRLDHCQLCGIHLASASGAKSHTLQHLGSRLSGAGAVRAHNPCTCRMQAPSALDQAAAPTCAVSQGSPTVSSAPPLLFWRTSVLQELLKENLPGSQRV